jgi:Cu-Zn family superoxide dismutase
MKYKILKFLSGFNSPGFDLQEGSDMKMRRVIYSVFLLVLGCQTYPGTNTARADLMSRSGSAVSGTVTLTQVPDGLRVVAAMQGLKPNAEHGFHVHDKGDCSAPDAMSAAGHFNPTGVAHGAEGVAHHAGDMPNVQANALGNATYTHTLKGRSLDGPQGVRGRAVVVHRDPDDYTSQPAGNSGPRVACGVIF